MGFFLSGSIYVEASLKPSLCSTQDLGATGHMSISRPGFKPGQQIDYEVGLFDPDF